MCVNGYLVVNIFLGGGGTGVHVCRGKKKNLRKYASNTSDRAISLQSWYLHHLHHGTASRGHFPFCFCIYLLSFLFFFLGLHLSHMEVSRLGIKLELQLLDFTTATATWDPSRVCDLHHSPLQHWILNSLSRARDGTCILTDTTQVLNPLSHRRSCYFFFSSHYTLPPNTFINLDKSFPVTEQQDSIFLQNEKSGLEDPEVLPRILRQPAFLLPSISLPEGQHPSYLPSSRQTGKAR